MSEISNPFRETALRGAERSRTVFDPLKTGMHRQQEVFELQYMGDLKSLHFLERLKDIKDKDMKRALERIKKQIKEFSIKKPELTNEIKNIETMIRGIKREMESAAGKTRDQFAKQLQILEERKEKTEEKIFLYPYLQKGKSTVREMIEAILQMRELEVAKNLSLAISTYEQKFRGDRSAFIQSVENTLKLDRISKDIERWESEPDTLVIRSGSSMTLTAPLEVPNRQKTKQLEELNSQQEKLRAQESQYLLELAQGQE